MTLHEAWSGSVDCREQSVQKCHQVEVSPVSSLLLADEQVVSAVGRGALPLRPLREDNASKRRCADDQRDENLGHGSEATARFVVPRTCRTVPSVECLRDLLVPLDLAGL